jgi:hypothetical protein
MLMRRRPAWSSLVDVVRAETKNWSAIAEMRHKFGFHFNYREAAPKSHYFSVISGILSDISTKGSWRL